MKPKNGVHKTTQLLDDLGSTVAVERTYHTDGILSRPIRHYYEINYKVSSPTEEHAAYLRFSDDIHADKSKLDPAWRIEHSKKGDERGYYICVASYTVLEY